MKKQEINNDKWLKQHFNQEDKETELPSNFTHRVMSKIEETVSKPKVKPLPVFGWVGWSIAAIFVVLIGLSVFLSPESASNLSQFNIDTSSIEKTLRLESVQLTMLILFSVSLIMLIDQLLLRRFK